MRRHRDRLNRWWILFCVIIAVLISSSAYSIHSLGELRRRKSWVLHSNQVIRTLERVSAQSANLLISARQLVSKSDSILTKPIEHDSDLQSLIESLPDLVGDNPEQITNANDLVDRVRALQNSLSELAQSSIANLQELNAGMEKPDRLLGEIHRIVQRMLDDENRLLSARVGDSESVFRNCLVAQIVSTSIAVFAAFSTIFLARRRFSEQLKVAHDRQLHDQQTEFLLNSSSDGICGVDAEGTCTRMNLAGARMLGYEVAELVGKNFHSMVHSKRPDGEFYPHQECPIYKAILISKPCRVEDEVFWHRNGHAIPVSYAAAPWIQHGKASGAVVSFSDISQRRRNEIELQAAHSEAEQARKAAELANSAKSNFLASMSHELRTPLNAVIMYSEMLQDEADDLQLANFSKDLTRIHTAGRHLLSLVNGVLDIAKIEAGKMELFVEEVAIQKILQDIVSTAKPLIEKNNNRLIVNSNAEGFIRVDVTKFRQIVLNLLSNAAKFTQHGTITLEVETHNSSVDPRIRVAVSDTGVGIAPDKLADLFKPFVQAEKSTSKDYGGTGLGLTLAKQFAELMHGSIDVSSKLDVGTTFVVTLPLRVDPEIDATANANSISKLALQNVDVLIIDDDQSTAEFVARALTSDGYSTAIANSGKDGIEVANRLSPKLIVLDVLMPHMDGWTVLNELKANPKTSAIPVVLLTVANQSELGFTLGAQEYLTKPVTREQLISIAHRFGIEHSGRKALVIDDDSGTRELLERLLKKEGWQVTQAADGAIATRIIESGFAPDMVLLDLQMPNMDGFDFLENVRKNVEFKAPVVVLTSRDLSVGERAWLADRVKSVLQKGGQSQFSLIESIRSVLQKEFIG